MEVAPKLQDLSASQLEQWSEAGSAPSQRQRSAWFMFGINSGKAAEDLPRPAHWPFSNSDIPTGTQYIEVRGIAPWGYRAEFTKCPIGENLSENARWGIY